MTSAENKRLQRHVAVLAFLALVAVVLAYQVRPSTTFDVARGNPFLLKGFYGTEYDAPAPYRWTGPDADVRFPSIGKTTPILLHIVAKAVRHEDLVLTATVTINGTPVGSITKAGWREWDFLIKDPALLRPDELTVGFHSPGYVFGELFENSNDDRELGVAVSSVGIRPQWAPPATLQDWLALATVPSPWQLLAAVVVVIGLYLATRIMGASEQASFCSACAVIILLAIQTAFFRLSQTEFALLALFVVGAVAAFNRRFVVEDDRSSVTRDSLSNVASSATALALHGKAPFFANVAVKAAAVVLIVWYVWLGAQIVPILFSIERIPGLLTDLTIAYERGLGRAMQGADPYDVRSVSPIRFYYPPPALFVIAPFAAITHTELKIAVFMALNVALLVVLVVAIARHYDYPLARIWWWFPLVLAFGPFLEVLQAGQINVISEFGILMMFVAQVTAPAIAGIGLALAGLTKVTPFALILYLVVSRRLQALSWFIASAAGALFLANFIFRADLLVTYLDVFRYVMTEFANNSVSLVSILMSLGWIGAASAQDAQRLLGLYLLVMMAASAWLAFRLNQSEPLFILLAMAVVVAPNEMWYHHYVFLLLPVLVWMAWSRLHPAVVAWCFAGLAVIQINRLDWNAALLPHLFVHASILAILVWQIFQTRKSRVDLFPYFQKAAKVFHLRPDAKN